MKKEPKGSFFIGRAARSFVLVALQNDDFS